MKYFNYKPSFSLKSTFVLAICAVLGACRPDAQLVSGDDHVCYRNGDETRCFGNNNDEGQCGTDSSTYSPQRIAGIVASSVNKISTGSDNSNALMIDGSVRSWGKTLINGKSTPTPWTLSDLGGVAVQVESGDEHSCAVVKMNSTQQVRCWGNNSLGQLGTRNVPWGDDEQGQQSGPVSVMQWDGSGAMGAVKSIAVGDNHSCALKNTGFVACWGYHGGATLGFQADQGKQYFPSTQINPAHRVCVGNNYCLLPQTVYDAGSGVSQLFAGGNHTCALFSDGHLECWGDNSLKQIAPSGTEFIRPHVVTDATGANFKVRAGVVSLSTDHTCALNNADGRLYCWGDNSRGQAAADPSASRPRTVTVPTALSAINRIVRTVSTGRAHTCYWTELNDKQEYIQCIGDLKRTVRIGKWTEAAAPANTNQELPVGFITRASGGFVEGCVADADQSSTAVPMVVHFTSPSGLHADILSFPVSNLSSSSLNDPCNVVAGIPGAHGFRVPFPTGSQLICDHANPMLPRCDTAAAVRAHNLPSTDLATLVSAPIVNAAPIGQITQITRLSATQVSISGNIYDPDSPLAAIGIAIGYAATPTSPQTLSHLVANSSSPALNALGIPGNHGFSITLTIPANTTIVRLWDIDANTNVNHLADTKNIPTN